MKKYLRMMSLIMVTMIMLMTTEVSAATEIYYWDLVKNPGMTDAGVDRIKIPMDAGTFTYTVSQLGGNCSCLIAKAESTYNNEYYINNANKCVMLTVPGGSETFTMHFVNGIKQNENMSIDCSIIHNADIGTLVYGSGTIYK